MAKYVFGVDVGGTTVKMGLFGADGNIMDKWEIPTRTENAGKEILPDIAESIRAKMAEKEIPADDVAGVGVGVPGPVDGNGIVHTAVNLGWGQFDLKKELTGLLGGMRVEGGNDANVAALGEMWKGGGNGIPLPERVRAQRGRKRARRTVLVCLALFLTVQMLRIYKV